MAVEKAIRDYLLTKSSVTALVGASGERLKPDVVEQTWTPNQGPFVTYEIISSDEEHGISDRSGFVASRIQFCAYAGTRMTANAAIRAIKNCGITGIKGTYSSVRICGVQIESGIKTYIEKPVDGQATYRYLSEIDLMVYYLED